MKNVWNSITTLKSYIEYIEFVKGRSGGGPTKYKGPLYNFSKILCTQMSLSLVTSQLPPKYNVPSCDFFNMLCTRMSLLPVTDNTI